MCVSYLLDGALTQDRSVIIATTNNPQKLDPAFKRAGRFDLSIELKNACHSQISRIVKHLLQRNISPNFLSKIQEYKWSPATFIFHIKNYVLDDAIQDDIIFMQFMTES